MSDTNDFESLDDIINPIKENIKKIKPLLAELIVLEKKLKEHGVKITVEINMNHVFE